MPGYNQSMKSDIIRRYRRKLRRVQLNFRRMNFTLIGDEGKPWRRAIAIAAGVLLLLVALIFGRAETQLMSSAEVKTVQERGVLRIGVIPDMPGAELEKELGRRIAAKLLPDADPESRIDEVLAAVDLADTGKKRAGRFSMGMRQRLGLALALIARPRLLVLDEPTNGLDPIGIEELRDQIRGFAAAGTTVIVSSHILSEVQQMADTIGIIYGGRLAYEDALRPGQDLEELFMSFCREGRRARGEVAA